MNTQTHETNHKSSDFSLANLIPTEIAAVTPSLKKISNFRRPITRKMHAAADYSFIPLAAAAPSLFGFSQEKIPTLLCRGMAAAVLGQSLLTDAEWGAVKLIPYQRHLQMDAVMGVTTLTAPWLFGFAQNKTARNVFLGLGVMALGAAFLSRPQNMSRKSK